MPFENPLSMVVAVILMIATPLGLIFFALYLYRGYEYLAKRSLERSYADLELRATPEPGDVILTYYTYHGLLVWFTQTPHQVVLSPRDARKLLGRLFRFNLTWGLITYGSLFIFPLAILNYVGQRRSIAYQAANGGVLYLVPPPGENVEEGVATIETKNPPSLVRRMIGWTLLLLTVTFGISSAVFLATGEFQAGIGGVLIAALLGWGVRDFLGSEKSD